MTTPFGTSPEEFHSSREPLVEQATIDSRYPAIPTLRDTMWPMKLHDESVRTAVSELLPELVDTLSEPVKPAAKDEVRRIFATNPHQRRLPWTFRDDSDGTYTYSTGAYEGQTDAKGSTPLFDGINYQFDANGRVIKREYIEGERSYQRGQPRFQEFLTYDDEGFLTERTTWGYIEPTITDRFDYIRDDTGKKIPSTMSRTQKIKGDSYGYIDSEPMVVDLANYEEWLTTNPNGYTTLTREQLSPKELEISDFTVAEHRRGVLFSHPEQLEHALVMYGNGSYPTPGDETALEHNDKAFADAHGILGGALFSLMSRSGDMHEFVSKRITDGVQDKWKQVQKSKKSDAEERVRFSFDYDGAGHFQKSNGDVTITKDGLELSLSAAYVGDKVEDQLASALQMKRGLRSASIEVPINQTERYGYFFVDIQAACEALGIPVTTNEISNYLSEYMGENDVEPRSSYDRKYGKQPVLWEDAENGVTVDVITERHDYETDTDLDDYFGHDTTALWGPLPKGVRSTNEGKGTPKVRVLVKPLGSPFSDETTQKTDKTIRKYLTRLQPSDS